MRFIHLGDLHLGKSLGEFDLIDDQRYILNRILEIIDKKKIDSVLIAGDVYDRAVPSEAATNLLDYFLRSLASRKVNTFMISGNHDSDDRLGYGSSLFETNRIYISSKFTGTLSRQTLCDEYGEVNIYCLPFVKASQVRHFFPEDKIENYDAAVRTILKHADIDFEKRNVIAAHQFVAGRGADPKLGGSEGVGTQSVGLVEKISYDCWDGFDYVALGHIHSPQRVGREEVRYSGSPLKYSLSEVNNAKSVPVVTLGEKGKVDIELIPLRPMRNMRHLRGPIEKLLDKANVSGPEDFIYATLTNEDIISDAMGIMQQVYPNTVKIDYDNSHTRELDRLDIKAITEHRSFSELISDFYGKMYNCEISEEELKVMMETAKEAGVIDETD